MRLGQVIYRLADVVLRSSSSPRRARGLRSEANARRVSRTRTNEIGRAYGVRDDDRIRQAGRTCQRERAAMSSGVWGLACGRRAAQRHARAHRAAEPPRLSPPGRRPSRPDRYGPGPECRVAVESRGRWAVGGLDDQPRDSPVQVRPAPVRGAGTRPVRWRPWCFGSACRVMVDGFSGVADAPAGGAARSRIATRARPGTGRPGRCGRARPAKVADGHGRRRPPVGGVLVARTARRPTAARSWPLAAGAGAVLGVAVGRRS